MAFFRGKGDDQSDGTNRQPNSPEGAAIGAVVGGVIGVIAGAYEPIEEQEQSVARCLSGKGYELDS